MIESTSPSAQDVVLAALKGYFTATLPGAPLNRDDAMREVFFAGAKAACEALGREDASQALEAQCAELAHTFGERAFSRTSPEREEPTDDAEPTIENWYKTAPTRLELTKLGPEYVALWDRIEGERAEKLAQERLRPVRERPLQPVIRVPKA